MLECGNEWNLSPGGATVTSCCQRLPSPLRGSREDLGGSRAVQGLAPLAIDLRPSGAKTARAGSPLIAEQRGYLVPEQGHLLVRLSQVGQEPQVVAADDPAGEQPGADAEQLVQFDELAV